MSKKRDKRRKKSKPQKRGSGRIVTIALYGPNDVLATKSVISSDMRQSQLDNGVRSLLSMLGQEAVDRFPPLESISGLAKRNAAQYLKEHMTLTIAESLTSIFSPSHAKYILRDGCP